MEDNNNPKKERRVSFAAEVETVFEYEDHRPETTVSSDEEFTADLTYENTKQLSIFNETTIISEFMQKNIKELIDPNKEKENVEIGNVEPVEERPLVQEENNKQTTEDLPFIQPRSFPKIKKSKRKSFSPFKKGSPNRKNKTHEDVSENEINLVESSVISNNSVEATEIINTQKLKFMIPQVKKQKSSITELFARKGIMFLDTISFAKIRRDTLSKTRNPSIPLKFYFIKTFYAIALSFLMSLWKI